MTDEDLVYVEGLVRDYTVAHQDRIALAEEADRRMLWSSPPVKTEYDVVLQAVRAVAARPQHSDAFVEGYVDDLLQAALDDPTRIVDKVRELGVFLDHPVATRLYIPLDGIVVEEAELRLGSVRLVKMDDDSFERLIVQPFVDIMRRNPLYDTIRANEAIEHHRNRLQSMRERTCLEVTTNLDLTGTFAQADSIADDVCDFLQVCIAALRARLQTNSVRWSNGIVQAWRFSFGASDGPRPRSNSSGQLAYGGPPAVIGTAALITLHDNGLLPLGEGLGQPPATEYAALLRRAVRWFAKGERERHADDRKLAYVTAVELFFSGGNDATRRFCAGFAFAMRTRPAEVAAVARSMYGVYASRSETSHEGAFDIESDEDIDHLRWEVLEFLARMAGHPFQTKSDIGAWVAERRAAMTNLEREILNEATNRGIVKQDTALMQSIGLIGGDLSMVPFDNAVRERVVLRRLLVDSIRERRFLLELRPLANDLKTALIAAHERGDNPVPVVLATLASLPWVADTLRTRMTWDIT